MSVLRFRPEARRNPGLAASCLMSIRYSVRYVLQGRYQGLSLFDAAFDLTWLTYLSSENGHLPGILRSPVQITYVTTSFDAGVDLRDVQIAARHADPRTTMRYDRARQNLDRHPNYILAAYMASVPNRTPRLSKARPGRRPPLPMSERCTCARLCTAMHTHSGFARPYQRSRAAFSTVRVGNQIADYFRFGGFRRRCRTGAQIGQFGAGASAARRRCPS